MGLLSLASAKIIFKSPGVWKTMHDALFEHTDMQWMITAISSSTYSIGPIGDSNTKSKDIISLA